MKRKNEILSPALDKAKKDAFALQIIRSEMDRVEQSIERQQVYLKQLRQSCRIENAL